MFLFFVFLLFGCSLARMYDVEPDPTVAANLTEQLLKVQTFNFQSRKTQSSSRHSWHDPSCNIQCKRSDFDTPPLIVISFDGFANKYRERKLTPALEKMGDCGAKTTQMFPSYPSKTFPNHYSIATGLYPESHGIVDNYVYDPKVNSNIQDVRKFKRSGYFRGEPIWSAAVRQGRKMFCLFYPGCSYKITNFSPTKDIPFGTKLTYNERIRMITDWLKLPKSQRPDLIMAYFDQPDSTGHQQSTEQVNKELQYIEKTVDLLLSTFKSENLLDCVNLVIVSDHGMQPLNKKFYVDKLVNTRGMIVSSGVVGRIYKTQNMKRHLSVLDQLTCKNPKYFRVYDRKRAPKRYHYAKDVRVGNVILEGRPGTAFWGQVLWKQARNSQVLRTRKDEYRLKADHGYDPLESNMRAIFFARGPNIKPRTQLQSFQNIELFNLFSDLLRLEKDTPNNGTDGALHSALQGITPMVPTYTRAFKKVQKCNGGTKLKFLACDSSCSSRAKSAISKATKCSNAVDYEKLIHAKESNFCISKFCSTAIVTSERKLGASTLIFERLKQNEIKSIRDPHVNRQPCSFVDSTNNSNCRRLSGIKRQKRNAQLLWRSVLVNYENPLKHLDSTQFLLYKQFASKHFNVLQQWTRDYARKYSNVLSITGVIYDFDFDGLADNENVVRKRVRTSRHRNEEPVPSHIVRVLVRCIDDNWNSDGLRCQTASNTRFLAFALPNVDKELNCLSEVDYLMTNTVRIRDIELLSGFQFFQDNSLFDPKQTINWRLDVTTKLWDF